MSSQNRKSRLFIGRGPRAGYFHEEVAKKRGFVTHLSDRTEVAPRQWFLEAGFGPLGGDTHPVFADLDAAQGWISQRLAHPARFNSAVS